ncbi:cytochrome c-type biogenesis CcmF C-terminal domain-containing protein, partial [Escherichia coli]
PLLTEAFGVKVSVGPPYFNPVSAIFVMPMLAVLLVGPLPRWRQDGARRISLPVATCAGLALAVFVALELAVRGIGLLPALG